MCAQTEDKQTEHPSIRQRLGRLEEELLKNEAEVELQMVKITRMEAKQRNLKEDIVRLKGVESRKRTFEITRTWPP